MLGLIFVALLQAASPTPVEPANQAAEAPAAAAPQEGQAATADAPRREAQRNRRCSSREITGTRLQTVQRCRTTNGQQDEDTRRALETFQRPPGTQGT